MKVILFIFPLVVFLWLHCGLAPGGALEHTDDSPKSLNGMSRSQKQHNRAKGQLLSSLSQEEQEWYQKFQNGLMLFAGWKEISADILKALPPAERPLTEQLLKDLGVRIGTEWSKDNNIRRIDTDQLRSWGDRLRKARQKGDTHLSRTVQAISTEVDELLNHPRRSGQINNS